MTAGRPGRLRLLALVAALAAAATGLAAVAGRLPGAPDATPGQLLALVPLLVLTGLLGLEFRVRGAGDRLDLFDAAVAVALLSAPGPAVLGCVAVAKAGTLAAQRVPLLKTCFNTAQWGLAAAAGSLVVAALRAAGPTTPRDLPVLLAALPVVTVLNTAAVLLVLRAAAGRSALATASRGLLRGSAVGGLVNLALGVLAAALWTRAPVGRAVVPVALVTMHLAVRLWAQRQAGAARLGGLQRVGFVLAGPDVLPDVAPRFLAELQRAFPSLGLELHLALGPGAGHVRSTWGPDDGGRRGAPLVAELLRRSVAVRLAPPDGDPELLALLAAAGWRDCLAVPVVAAGRTVGLLLTHDRQGWQGFEREELRVLEAVAVVLGESVRRSELAQVLREERAALSASQERWRALAEVLELVSAGASLPDALDLLACMLEDQTSARCVVLVRAPEQGCPSAAPALPEGVVDAMRTALLPSTPSSDVPSGDGRPVPLTGPLEAALRSAGVGAARSWPLPCSSHSGATGLLVLCYGKDAPQPASDGPLASDAARVAGLVVDHLVVQHRLAHQAGHDPLTDLPNRVVFLDRLRQALATSARTGTSVLVMFLDLDRFKVVNDSLGHRAGDALLGAVAQRLRAAVRPRDVVARFGGDEFMMLCEDVEDETHALQVVQRVRHALDAPFPLGESELFATSSIGMALGRGTGRSAEMLVEDADAAMYRAKELGGNRLELFDDDMRDRAVHRLATHSALHRGVEREEFRVVYQPTVRLPSGAVDGVEALVRWHRPDHGVVPPGEFVPMAEETGLIVPIGAQVLEEACRQARCWRDEVPDAAPPSVSVNLSARQLTDPGLVPLVRGALERSGVDPTTISLEITESALMTDLAASGGVLDRLKALGVRLFVDDFGTGYSSLTYLQHFPVDGVKVDRSFVAGLGSRPDDEAIVRAVIGLGHSLGLVVVAEGVETAEQLDRLIDMRCDVAQGYHLGRPASPDRVLFGLPVR